MPFRALSINQTPLTYFEVYYRNLLEFSTCATMTLNGIVYCNGNIDVGPGSGATLTFTKTVAASGVIIAPQNNGQSYGDANKLQRQLENLLQRQSLQSHEIAAVAIVAFQDQLSRPDRYTRDQRSNHSRRPPTALQSSSSNLDREQCTPFVFKFFGLFENSKSSHRIGCPGSDPAPILAIYTNLFLASQNTNLPFLNLDESFL